MMKIHRFAALNISAIVILFSSSSFATLGDDTGIPTGIAGTLNEVNTANAVLEADIQKQTSICESNPGSDACGTARERIRLNQEQILSNSAVSQQLQTQMLNTGSRGDGQKLMEMAGMGDKLRGCAYAAAVACSLLGGPGKEAPTSLTDLASRSLSGQKVPGSSSLAPIRLPDTAGDGGLPNN